MMANHSIQRNTRHTPEHVTCDVGASRGVSSTAPLSARLEITVRRRIKEYAMTHDANHRLVPRRGLPNIGTTRALLRFKKALGLRPRLDGDEARNPKRTFAELRLSRFSPDTRATIQLRDARDELNAHKSRRAHARRYA